MFYQNNNQNNNQNNYYFNDFTINISSYIVDDMLKMSNPIKYHNNNFNKKFKLIEPILMNLFINSFNKLKSICQLNIINSLSSDISDDFTPTVKYDIFPIYHKFPINYQIYVNHTNQFLSYDEFNDKFNKRILNSSYDKLIVKYIKRNMLIVPNIKILELLTYFQICKFISLDIKLYVENNHNKCKYYFWSHMNFYFFYSNQINSDTYDDILKQIYIVSKWIYDMNPIYKINFVYFDTPLEKIINEQSDFNYLSSQNINSGSSSSGHIVIIWRREEILKVLIHELIHYLELDIKYDNNLNLLKSLGQFKYPILINETITEIQAQLYHIIYQTIISSYNFKTLTITNLNNEILNKLFDKFKIFYNYEQIFSWYQFAKIMKYYNIYNYNQNELLIKFNQTTNVFSYYIFKCILNLYFDQIFHVIPHIRQLNNNESQLIICNVHKCDLLINIIKSILNNLPIKFINVIINKLSLNDKLNNSLRMVLFSKY